MSPTCHGPRGGPLSFISAQTEREAQCAGFSLLPQKSGEQETLASEEVAALRSAMIPLLARAQDSEQM